MRVPGSGAVVELEAAELLLERDGPVEALGDDAFEEELEVSNVRKRAGERGNVAELLGQCRGLPGVGLRSSTTILFGGRESDALEDPCAQQVITVGFCQCAPEEAEPDARVLSLERDLAEAPQTARLASAPAAPAPVPLRAT